MSGDRCNRWPIMFCDFPPAVSWTWAKNWICARSFFAWMREIVQCGGVGMVHSAVVWAWVHACAILCAFAVSSVWVHVLQVTVSSVCICVLSLQFIVGTIDDSLSPPPISTPRSPTNTCTNAYANHSVISVSAFTYLSAPGTIISRFRHQEFAFKAHNQ